VLPGAHVPLADRTGYGEASFVTRNEIILDQSQSPAEDPSEVHLDDARLHDVKVVTEEVNVPVEVVCDDEDAGCCRDCNAKPRTRVDLAVLVSVIAFVLRRRRPG
jgi:hypothetical protein